MTLEARLLALVQAFAADIKALSAGKLDAGAGGMEIVEDDIAQMFAHALHSGIGFIYDDAGRLVLATVNSAPKLATARTINGVAFDGSANITLNAVDATGRVASSEKGAANGLATLGADGKLAAGQVPSLALSSLTGVAITAPVTGQELAYNGTNFINRSRVSIASAAPSAATSYPGDIYINDATGLQFVLVLDGANKVWVSLG